MNPNRSEYGELEFFADSGKDLVGERVKRGNIAPPSQFSSPFRLFLRRDLTLSKCSRRRSCVLAFTVGRDPIENGNRPELHTVGSGSFANGFLVFAF